MRWGRRKQVIKISRALVVLAMEDAAQQAARREIQRQTQEQYGDRGNVYVEGCDVTVTDIQLFDIPDTDRLTFEYVD